MNALEENTLIHVYQIPITLFQYVRKTRKILKWEFCDPREEYCYVYVDAIQGREDDDWEDYFKLTSDTSATREWYLKENSALFWIQNVPAKTIFDEEECVTHHENAITRVVISSDSDDDDSEDSDDPPLNVVDGHIVIN